MLSRSVLARARSRSLVLGPRAAPGFEAADSATLACAINLAMVARTAHLDLSAAARADKHTAPNFDLLLAVR
jgi:hypothetical protein